LELSDFFRVITENGTPRVTVDDGVKALEIALAARESYQTGQKFELSQLAVSVK
jgi:scyllo-inositol 2-dehydrogenase (NAD+)